MAGFADPDKVVRIVGAAVRILKNMVYLLGALSANSLNTQPAVRIIFEYFATYFFRDIWIIALIALAAVPRHYNTVTWTWLK